LCKKIDTRGKEEKRLKKTKKKKDFKGVRATHADSNTNWWRDKGGQIKGEPNNKSNRTTQEKPEWTRSGKRDGKRKKGKWKSKKW